MSAHPEEILGVAVHGREALHLGDCLETPHLALALARRLMGDFRSIVHVLVRDVDHGRHHVPTWSGESSTRPWLAVTSGARVPESPTPPS